MLWHVEALGFALLLNIFYLHVLGITESLHEVLPHSIASEASPTPFTKLLFLLFIVVLLTHIIQLLHLLLDKV